MPILTAVNSYNFLLVNPIFGFSHVKFMSKIADILADSGHSVTLLQPFHMPMENLDGLVKNKNVEILNWYPSNFEELKKKEVQTFSFIWDSALVSNPAINAIFFPGSLANEFKNTATGLLQDEDLLEKLKAKKFDAVVAEVFEISGFYLGHLLEIPSTIATMSAVAFPGTERLFGQGSYLGYVPAAGSRHGADAGFLDRLNNIYSEFFEKMLQSRLFDHQHKMCAGALEQNWKNGDVPDWKTLISKSTYYFTNSNPYLNFAEPTVGSIVQVGGLTMEAKDLEKRKQLPEEYEEILNERKFTILVSFGSAVRSSQMPESFKSGVIQTFKNLPDITFIWKYEEPEDADFKMRLPPNVHLKKWVPQQALLADPRLTLFITHGGLGSTMEVAYTGITALMVPIFGDQPRNAAMLARHGGAINYSKFDLAKPEKLTKTIKEMIGNPKYKTAAVQFQNILHNQPTNPKKVLVKNMEFAVKFPELKSQVPEISSAGYIGYYYIDVFVFLAIISIGLLYLTFCFVIFFGGILPTLWSRADIKAKSE